MNEVPHFTKDLIHGVSVGLAVSLPFVVLWLSFVHTKTFKLEYMKEISLLVIWIGSLASIIPLKTLKVTKDGVQLGFVELRPIPPEEAISS